jgi:hypothetical protein
MEKLIREVQDQSPPGTPSASSTPSTRFGADRKMQDRMLAHFLIAWSAAKKERDEDAGMKDAEDLQFEQANVAINKAVNKFVSEIESMFGRWEDVVAPSYIDELWQLCTEVPKLADDGLKVFPVSTPETN